MFDKKLFTCCGLHGIGLSVTNSSPFFSIIENVIKFPSILADNFNSSSLKQRSKPSRPLGSKFDISYTNIIAGNFLSVESENLTWSTLLYESIISFFILSLIWFIAISRNLSSGIQHSFNFFPLPQ